MDHIDDVVIADERDEQSPGMRLARKHAIELAPFFIVQDGDETRIYTVYLKFVKAELDSAAGPKSADAEDILRANPDLDAI